MAWCETTGSLRFFDRLYVVFLVPCFILLFFLETELVNWKYHTLWRLDNFMSSYAKNSAQFLYIYVCKFLFVIMEKVFATVFSFQNATIGTTILTVKAYDIDDGRNAFIGYSLKPSKGVRVTDFSSNFLW